MSGRPKHDTVLARATPPVAAHPDIACRGADPRVFFPNSGGTPTHAIAICRICPHRQECLDWALETRQGHGVWGGTTAEERHEMLKLREDA